jgi:hypothetical protein
VSVHPIGFFVLFISVCLHPLAGFGEPLQYPATQPSASALSKSETMMRDSADQSSQNGGSQSGSNQSGSDELGRKGDRLFGVLPNNGTVEGATKILPISNKEMFKIAAEDSFDPYVFPFVGATAGLAQLEGQEKEYGLNASGYGRRYAVALADNTIGNFLTTAIVPSIMHEDPRYFQLGEGGFWHRAGYAASRAFVTRTRSGRPQFNVAEIGGNGVGALISNLYYPSSDRTVSDTLTRWGTQVMWDLLADEMKEFWPDIRRRIHKSPQDR